MTRQQIALQRSSNMSNLPTEETYSVHVRLGDKFEDILVRAKDEAEAIHKAKNLTTLNLWFASFTI
jgi:hypothetical protein